MTVLVAYDLLSVAMLQIAGARWSALAGQLLFTFIIAMLIYGALVYQFTRLGYYRRRRLHVRATPEQLGALWDKPVPKLTILVPSYMEEPETVTQTLLSAALQDYPDRNVVLLIDDSPAPAEPGDAQRLARIRSLSNQIMGLIRPLASRMHEERVAFSARLNDERRDREAELKRLSKLNHIAAEWFLCQANKYDQSDHVAVFFRSHILESRYAALIERADELQSLANRPSADPVSLCLLREYRRLETLFDVEITSFERKQVENLSHEPNKAMNLNAYIGLMGGYFRKVIHGKHEYLEPVKESEAELAIADPDYLLTLDADSILLPEYAARLVTIAEQSGNERLAVVQTPYSAFPDAPGQLERMAGASTDIQYIVHQGFTHSNATYWVGANALIRKTALCDIATSQQERGHSVPVFIQDRTVIEDTESTVDLIARGWRLHNYPERLAYSATPPDFGALLILPKLLRYLRNRIGKDNTLGEALQRVHYLVSITAVNFGLVVIMAFPLTEGMPSVWLPLTVASYFILLGRDLSQCGYKVADLVRFYALTIVLIPVNIGGVCKSLQQVLTGKRIPFARTPKVTGHTATPAIYILAIFALLVHWVIQFTADVDSARWFHAIFVASNTLMLLYGLVIFIGLRASIADIALGVQLKISGLFFRKPNDQLLSEVAGRSK